MGSICQCQNIRLLSKLPGSVRLHGSISASSQVQASPHKHKEIQIPKRKKRDEYSVLRALASTVEQDHDSAHYKFIDDPYLIPTSTFDKKMLSLAKTAGKQAAQHVMQNYSQFFENRPMEDFSYTPEAYKVREVPKQSADSLDGLMERIDMKKPMLAYQSYQQIRDKGDEVPSEVVGDLLELLCFYNSKEVSKLKDVEELHLAREIDFQPRTSRTSKSSEISKTWDSKGVAETLFREVENPDQRAYSSLLRGRAKYKAGAEAFDLHNEMKEKNIKLTRTDYTALLSVVNDVAQGRQIIDLLTKLLKEMQTNDIDPDIDTFNTVLQVLCSTKHISQIRQDVLKYGMNVINEMRNCEIEPTLASWFYVLTINYFVRGKDTHKTDTSKLLYELMDYIQDKEFEMQHKDDCRFFSFAMICCADRLNDLNLALKVDTLLNVGNNMQFIGESFDVSTYYFRFIRLLCTFAEVETVMEYYEKLTPHDYSVTYGTLQEVIQCVNLHDAFEYLPRLWSDFILFNYQRNIDLLMSLLGVMSKTKHDPQLQDIFVGVTDFLVEQYEDDSTRTRMTKPFQFSGGIIGECISICCHGVQQEKARKLFEMYFTRRHVMDGFPSEKSLHGLAELCIKVEDVKTAMNICQIMSDLAYPKIDIVADKMKKELDLTEEQLNHLADLL